MKPIRFLLVALLGLSLSMSSHQPITSSQYPGLTVMLQNQVNNKTNFAVKKWGMIFKIRLEKVNGNITIKLRDAQNNPLGSGKISLVGNERVFTLTQSINGIASLWHFAIDRTSNNNGILIAETFDPNSYGPTVDCQGCCFDEHLSAWSAYDEEYAEERIAAGDPPKEWGWYYELPPDDARNAYLGCVDDCLTGGECSGK